MPDLMDVRSCLCLRTRRSARVLTQFYDAHLRPSGLRVTQFTLMAAIAEMTPVAQQPLARLMGMDRTTLTRNLAVLERDGLVTVGHSAADQRQREIRLTTGGEAAIRRARPLWERAQRQAAEVLAGGGDAAEMERWTRRVEQLGEGALTRE